MRVGGIAALVAAAWPFHVGGLKLEDPDNSRRVGNRDQGGDLSTSGLEAWSEEDLVAANPQDATQEDFIHQLREGAEAWTCGAPTCTEEPSLAMRAEVPKFWTCKENPPWTGSGRLPDRAVAVMIRGESFRDGVSSHRYRGGNKSLKPQLRAWQSVQAYVVDPFEAENYSVDIFSATYPTNASSNFSLQSVLGRNLVNASFTRGGGSQGRNAWDVLIAAALHSRAADIAYRYVLVLRHDTILYQNMVPFMKSDDKFMIPFYWYANTKCNSVLPTTDVVQAFPGKYLGCLLNVIAYRKKKTLATWPQEFIAGSLTDLWTLDVDDPQLDAYDFGVMLNVSASSNTGHVKNPLYGTSLREKSGKPWTNCSVGEICPRAARPPRIDGGDVPRCGPN